MKLHVFTGGFVQTNGYVLETPEGNLLIDAPEGVTAWLEEQGLRVSDVLLTHQHYDHVMDCAALNAAGVKIHALEDYSKDLTLENAARAWGLPISVKPYEVDVRLDVKSPLQILGLEIGMEHVPGHSTDSVTFHVPELGILFSGDTLFQDSIGRADLPGGNMKQLVDGIVSKLLVLPEETQVFPGHGYPTTIGDEAAGNPYLT